MTSTNKRVKKMIGMMTALITMICACFWSALQASAAISGDQQSRFAAAKSSGSNETLLIVIIIILVIALIGAGVVFFVVLNKKKDSPSQPSAPTPVYPPQQPMRQSMQQQVQQPMQRPMQRPMQQQVQQPVQQQTPPFAAPKSYRYPQQQMPPVNNAAPAPAPVPNKSVTPPAPAAPKPFEHDLNDDLGETTILGTGPEGFILLRKNGGDKVCVNKPKFIIGKEKSKVDYCISNNNSVSRKHAEIRVRAGKCYIADLGSTNYTYINGTKLNPNQEVALIPGDEVKFSNEEFEFIG